MQACCSTKAFGLARPARRPQASRRLAVRAVAEGEAEPSAAAPAPAGPASVSQIEFKKDAETFQDVMGFSGVLPERTNGRLAMIAFVAAAAAELSTGQPVVQQLAGAPFQVLSFSLSIFLAGFFPKFAAGEPLGELLAITDKPGAMGEGFSAIWTANTELLTGRVAMLGFVGLLVTEAVLGKALL